MKDDFFKEIAENSNTTPEEIRRSMQAAIIQALMNPTPQSRKFWKNIPKKGGIPTPEEVYEYMKLCNKEEDEE